MNLTKKDIQQICNIYEIGEVKEFKIIPGGMINYNFKVRTDKGEFIVRKLGYKLNNKYWARQKKLEFLILDYLHENNFPYPTPTFLRNKRGKYISLIKGHLYEAYPRIKGRKISKLNEHKLESVAKALAVYHKYVSNFDIPKEFKKVDNYGWIKERYAKMKKIRPKTKLDNLALLNVEFFDSLLDKLLKMKLNKGLLITHSDFNKGNIVFKGDEISGILDFENVRYEPKSNDFIKIVKPEKPKFKKFLKLYRKYGSFSELEEKNIFAIALLKNCNLFWWSYFGMKKRPELRYTSMLRTIRKTKLYYKLWKQNER